jgi:hypothetical protein
LQGLGNSDKAGSGILIGVLGRKTFLTILVCNLLLRVFWGFIGSALHSENGFIVCVVFLIFGGLPFGWMDLHLSTVFSSVVL